MKNNIIIGFKRFLRRNELGIEFWDASAISTWLDLFIELVKSKSVRIIVIEGVFHEISAGRHNYEKCRIAYKFIEEAIKEGLIEYLITPDKMQSWKVDDQLVAESYEYYNKGYDVVLVTCDRNQANKAEYRGVTVKLLKGNRTVQTTTKAKSQPTIIETEATDELKVPCIKKGNMTYINVNSGFSVYDAKGKRKIGRDNLISVLNTDILIYKENNYTVESTTDTYIALKKMNST